MNLTLVCGSLFYMCGTHPSKIISLAAVDIGRVVGMPGAAIFHRSFLRSHRGNESGRGRPAGHPVERPPPTTTLCREAFYNGVLLSFGLSLCFEVDVRIGFLIDLLRPREQILGPLIRWCSCPPFFCSDFGAHSSIGTFLRSSLLITLLNFMGEPVLYSCVARREEMAPNSPSCCRCKGDREIGTIQYCVQKTGRLGGWVSCTAWHMALSKPGAR